MHRIVRRIALTISSNDSRISGQMMSPTNTGPVPDGPGRPQVKRIEGSHFRYAGILLRHDLYRQI